MSALWPVQVAVYGALSGNAALAAYAPPSRPATTGVSVYDGEAAQDATAPYIVLGSNTEVPAHTFGRKGWGDTLTIHVWSSYPGRKEALEVLELIDAALALPLAINGHQDARLHREFSEVLIDPDGSRHVPARYRVTTREVA